MVVEYFGLLIAVNDGEHSVSRNRSKLNRRGKKCQLTFLPEKVTDNMKCEN